ncbi:MAG: hypothetical protein AB9895_00130 [Negativicutes bacterium]
MKQQIIITEVNQPSTQALKAFNQCVFNTIQKQHNSQGQEERRVKHHG